MPILLYYILLIVPDKAVHLYNVLYFTHKNVKYNFEHKILKITEIKVKRIQSQHIPFNPRLFANIRYTLITKCIVETDDIAVWTWRHFPPQLSSEENVVKTHYV
jgi:hypothetical protein